MVSTGSTDGVADRARRHPAVRCTRGRELFDADALRPAACGDPRGRLAPGQHARVRAARGPDAAADARRARRPAAAPGRGLAAAPADRGRQGPLVAAVGTPGHGEDHDRGDRQRPDRPLVRGGLGGLRGRQGGAGGDRTGPQRPDAPRPRDRAVRRRGPSVQQGAAGRAAARRREPMGHPRGRHHGEPVLLGDLAAAVAQPAAPARLADRRRRHRGARPRPGRRARPGRGVHARRRRPGAPGPPGRRGRPPFADLSRGRCRARRAARVWTPSTWPPPRPRSTGPRSATTGRATSTTT